MVVLGEYSQQPQSFFMPGKAFSELDLDELEAAFIGALSDGTKPEAAVCFDISCIEAIFREVERREAARRLSGMFGALLREEYEVALDRTEQDRHAPPSNWMEDVI